MSEVGIRVGQRVRMLEDYWYENKGREGVVSRFTISPLDDGLSSWIRLNGDDHEYPMPHSVYELVE